MIAATKPTKSTSLQLTVRGIDHETKEALVKKAALEGKSLNKLAIESLRRAAGMELDEVRYREMKIFLSKNRMSKADKKAFDEAIALMDKASKEKQARENYDFGL